METFPNQFEQKGEKVHTKEEVMEIFRGLSVPENAVVDRERSDEKGVTMLAVKIECEKPGEITEYVYTRTGDHGDQNATLVTGIDVVYYDENEIPMGGDRIAEFDEATGEWKIFSK